MKRKLACPSLSTGPVAPAVSHLQAAGFSGPLRRGGGGAPACTPSPAGSRAPARTPACAAPGACFGRRPGGPWGAGRGGRATLAGSLLDVPAVPRAMMSHVRMKVPAGCIHHHYVCDHGALLVNHASQEHWPPSVQCSTSHLSSRSSLTKMRRPPISTPFWVLMAFRACMHRNTSASGCACTCPCPHGQPPVTVHDDCAHCLFDTDGAHATAARLLACMAQQQRFTATPAHSGVLGHPSTSPETSGPALASYLLRRLKLDNTPALGAACAWAEGTAACLG